MRLFRRTLMPASAAQLYAFHERPDALAQLIPPWERIRIVEAPTSLAKGTRVVLVQWFGPLRFQLEEPSGHHGGRVVTAGVHPECADPCHENLRG